MVYVNTYTFFPNHKLSLPANGAINCIHADSLLIACTSTNFNYSSEAHLKNEII